MLKYLRLKSERKQAATALAELRAKKAEFEERTATLGEELENATTEEAITEVETKISELEAEIAKADVDTAIGVAESEIERIDGEIKDIEARSKEATKKMPTRNKEGVEVTMARGFWKEISEEQRTRVLADESTKNFIGTLRTFKGQTRAVSGAELTIPEVSLGIIRDNLHRYSKLISQVTVKSVSGKARQNIIGAVPEGVWTEAIGTLNELAFTINQVEVDAYKVGGYIPLYNSILEDSDINLAGEVFDMIGQAIGYAVDKAILFGTGNKMPVGIATRLAQTEKPASWGTNAPTWTNLTATNLLKIDGSLSDTKFFAALVKALGTAKANYSTGRKFWVMNTETKATLLSKAITFNSAGAIAAGVNDTMPIIGGNIITFDSVANGDIIGGYGDMYLLAERGGISLSQSEHAKFIEDITMFKGTARYDGIPIFGESFVMVNINNLEPTTTVAFATDSAN